MSTVSEWDREYLAHGPKLTPPHILSTETLLYTYYRVGVCFWRKSFKREKFIKMWLKLKIAEIDKNASVKYPNINIVFLGLQQSIFVHFSIHIIP